MVYNKIKTKTTLNYNISFVFFIHFQMIIIYPEVGAIQSMNWPVVQSILAMENRIENVQCMHFREMEGSKVDGKRIKTLFFLEIVLLESFVIYFVW